MAVRPILEYTHPVLRRKAQRVDAVTGEIRRLIKEMRETMKAASGVGLAAPQVGESLQILVYETEEARGCLLNPVIEEMHGDQTDVEGCLSIPGLQGEVTRALRIRVKGMDERGKPVTKEAEGYLARVLQHEIDHLNGILFIDRARPETLHRIPPRRTEPAPSGSRLAKSGSR
ncbi:MAG: peptide deformylase [Armatimonadetes bacterium]|nr:peptide deformylase [Armatimonadota bacterium]